MTKTGIRAKLEAKAIKLSMSREQQLRFVIGGTRCQVRFGSDTALHYGYKRPLMSGYEDVASQELVDHIYRFQF